MSVVRRCLTGASRTRLAARIVLSLSLPALAGVFPAQAQTTNQTTTGTNAAIPAPTPSIFPTPTASSQTCLFGCNSQLQACQSTCISTITGATVMPSMTTVGTTTSPTACQSNCSAQLQTCQRNCNLGP